MSLLSARRALLFVENGDGDYLNFLKYYRSRICLPSHLVLFAVLQDWMKLTAVLFSMFGISRRMVRLFELHSLFLPMSLNHLSTGILNLFPCFVKRTSFALSLSMYVF